MLKPVVLSDVLVCETDTTGPPSVVSDVVRIGNEVVVEAKSAVLMRVESAGQSVTLSAQLVNVMSWVI